MTPSRCPVTTPAPFPRHLPGSPISVISQPHPPGDSRRRSHRHSKLSRCPRAPTPLPFPSPRPGFTMNFEGLNPSLAEFAPPLHPALEPVLDPHLNPSLVELDPEGVSLEGLPVPESVHLMEGMYSELHTAVSEVGVPVSVSHFDLHEEMLWVGNHGGHATSFFGPTLERYSSFQVNSSDDIRQIQSLENGVLFLTKTNLKYLSRGGLIIFDYLSSDRRCPVSSHFPWREPCVPPGANSHSAVPFPLLPGQCQFCEPTGLANPADIFHVNTVGPLIMTFDVSASKQALAFGDSEGCVHLWADSPEVTFNAYSRETDFALPCMVDTLPHLDWNQDLVPLSLIPVPLTSDALLSDWPAANSAPAPRRAPPVDPEILRTMKKVGFIGYAPNPRTKLRNQIPYRLKEMDNEFDTFSQVPESPIGREEEPHLYRVAKKYRKVTIKYSKLGLEDFDFKHYNKTLFAGLEPHIPNAYCNCMIQVLYFLEPVRCLVQNHLCQKEFCLGCELGLLFHMLDLSRGDPCQGSNFLRAFRTIPEASALGLILADSDEATGKVNLGRLIQSWNRFILTQLHQETQEQEGPQAYRGAGSSSFGSSGDSVIGQLFSCEMENCSMCRCGKETVRVSSTLLFTLSYPDSTEKPAKDYEFAQILKRSICLEQNTQAWCENCEKYQPTVQTRNIRCLPDVLVINCEVNSSKEADFWKTQAEYSFQKAMMKRGGFDITKGKEIALGEWKDLGNPDTGHSYASVEELKNIWIPHAIKMRLTKSKELDVSNWSESDELSPMDDPESVYIYDLMATVVHILDSRTGGSLVGHIKVGETYHQRKEGVTHQQWYLFNDFLIEPVDKCEAVQFDMSWKVPAILYYARRNLNAKYNLVIKNPIEASVLLAEASLARKQRKCHATFIPLMLNEMPQAGDLVGLDAEFVTLNEEEAELRSDGTKSTIKPSQMSVARITCVRGQGPNEGVPFIDDYISTQEQVVDYLTQYSGIKPGDLDAKISSKHLTTLKSTYLKLRFLIDVGVKFVGHGLQKDFRVINLMVPKDQVIDTVYLFHIPRKRMISLRFLAWYFLDLKIQGETHDSIEDARTALQLYRKYLELSPQGSEPEEFRKVLKGLYEKGRKLDWKVPEPDSQSSPKHGAVFPPVLAL
ncbi:PAN2-PAN3 deadenylation complex catalytic subunit PAN2 [Parus major]|uniref:PAN2-PAN3 deadenylation complex catalytic subunit PAN2 n=1 Tax=Parus major TaxID=9157 RepID=UPI001443A23D|nr:PAN2-PAN3 deadenylation complex catalytic subunit PAN2 [Parus major]